MESLSLDISSVDEKDEHQMITLVDTSNLDGNDLVDNSLPLVHVLEPSDLSKDSSDRFYDNTHCLICNAQFGVSGRGAVHLFSDEVKTTCRHLDLPILLSNIIQRELNSSNMHSTTICKKCFKFLDDIDSIESQLVNMKQEVTSKFFQTQVLVQHEKNMNELAKDDSILPESHISNDDREYKITSRVKNKKKRGRGRKRTPAYVKLEVKEESYEGINFVDYVSSSQNDPLRVLGDEGFGEIVKVIGSERSMNSSDSKSDVLDIFEVDGLDLNNEDSTIQIGGIVLPTVSNGVANKELFPGNTESLPGIKISKYKCRFCQITSSMFSEMQNHLVQFHGDRLFECEVCGEHSDSQAHLLEHLEQHLLSGEKPFSCTLCSRRYALPRQLKEHLRHHLSKTIPCYHCSKRFKTENALQEHMNTHTGFRPYECEQCHKRFSSKYVLKTHMRTHGTRNRPHKCKVCQKHFLTANHLNDHLQIHQNRKDFICENCGKAFGTQRSLDLHSITHSGVKNFVCRICFKAFARKGEVEDHERIHTGEKPFQCEICGSTFSQRSNLQSHKRATHFEEKKYQCTECNKAFKRRRLLVYHVMSVHTGERPYKCSYCTAAFVYPEHYKKHLRIHTGEKPFKCEICGKAFNSRDNKNAHKFIHSEKKQYECTLCGSGFMRKPQLMGHIQQHDRTGNIEAYIKVNSSSVVDAELIESRAMQSPTLALKIDEEQSIDNNLDHIQLVRNPVEVEAVDISRQIQLSDDVPHYVIHKAGDKSDESVDHFLASLRGQVVEVRAEDLERYTELTADQISQMAQVAAQVVVTQGNAGGSTQLSQETPDFRLFQIHLDDDTKGHHRQADNTAIISTSSPLVAQSKIATSTTTITNKSNYAFKKNSQILNNTSNNNCEDSNNSTNIRQNRNWGRSNNDFIESS